MNTKHIYNQKLTTIGGGTGQFELLRGLVALNNPKLISAIVATWDSGGSSGELRVKEGIMPPGDYMQCVLALMEDIEQLEEAVLLLRDRSNGHPLVNLLASMSEKIHHGVEGGIGGISRLFRVNGKVWPVSYTDLILYADTTKGRIITGEQSIDRLKDDDSFLTDSIHRIYFDTPAKASSGALESIGNSQKIIFSSGSPITSVFPHLLVEGIVPAIQLSKAELIVVLNLMTTRGEDHNLGLASRWLKMFQYYLGDREWISKHGKSRISYLVANENHMDPESLDIYAKKGQYPVEVDDEACLKMAPGMKVLSQPLASYDRTTHLLRHDRKMLGELILALP